MSIFKRLIKKLNYSQSTIIKSDDNLKKYHDLIDAYIAFEVSNSKFCVSNPMLGSSEAGMEILNLDSAEAINMLLVCIHRYDASMSKYHGNKRSASTIISGSSVPQREAGIEDIYVCEGAIFKSLMKRKLTFTPEQLTTILDFSIQCRYFTSFVLPIASIVSAVENHTQNQSVSEIILEQIPKFQLRIEQLSGSEHRQLANRLALLTTKTKELPLLSGEAWSDAALQYGDNLKKESKNYQAFVALLLHCQQSSASKPSAKWIKAAELLVSEFGQDNMYLICLEWFSLTDKPRTELAKKKYDWEPDPNLLLNDANADVLKGLIWCCSIRENAEIARALVKLGLSCFKKVPGLGPRAVRVGNACIYALANMPGRTGLYQLAVLKVKIKYRSALNILNKALNDAALREGITVDELEEMGVPSYGLERVGYGEEVIGEYTAIIEIPSLKTVDLKWRKADGKLQKTIPTVVKDEHGPELKELRGSVKDIKSMASVQKERIEQLFLKEKTWTFDTWSERYLNHQIVGLVARKLIWRFSFENDSKLAIYYDGEFIGKDGESIEIVETCKEVSLWHPITSEAIEIKAWREKIQELEISQPFKQAHREVYLLTDAEINTRTYSNRFASHLIKQHQFNALASARGWRYSLQGAWDGGDDIARLNLDRFNLWAEFWVQGIGEYGNDTTEAGVFNYVSTDQVRFYQIKSSLSDIDERNINEQIPVSLTEIPALVLSEVLRDVDLFVGVCSVGNDPEWADGGPDGRYRDYWHSFSFGDLSASANTRKEILEHLIPKLKIAPQCKFVDKFLVVEGSRRIYKIHLGSGNILMEPNNQYLCIVSDNRKKSSNDKVFLPFEGDNMLSVILSKAVLLAEDKKIKDSTINSQIDHYK